MLYSIHGGDYWMKITNTAERLKSLMSEFNYRQVDILKKCKPFCDQNNWTKDIDTKKTRW